MKATREEFYNLTLNRAEGYNLVRVLIEYLDNFEKDSYETDDFTRKALETLLVAIGDKTLIEQTTERIYEIQKRCEER